MRKIGTASLILIAWLCAPALGRAGDWPQFRGPEGTGEADETGLARSWANGAPPVLWRRPLGEGFSGLSVSGDGLYTLYAAGDDELVAGFRTGDGTEVWQRRVGEKFVDHWGNGPRATPAVEGGTVYALGSQGALLALRAGDGEVVWQADLEARFGSPNRPVG